MSDNQTNALIPLAVLVGGALVFKGGKKTLKAIEDTVSIKGKTFKLSTDVDNPTYASVWTDNGWYFLANTIQATSMYSVVGKSLTTTLQEITDIVGSAVTLDAPGVARGMVNSVASTFAGQGGTVILLTAVGKTAVEYLWYRGTGVPVISVDSSYAAELGWGISSSLVVGFGTQVIINGWDDIRTGIGALSTIIKGTAGLTLPGTVGDRIWGLDLLKKLWGAANNEMLLNVVEGGIGEGSLITRTGDFFRTLTIYQRMITPLAKRFSILNTAGACIGIAWNMVTEAVTFENGSIYAQKIGPVGFMMVGLYMTATVVAKAAAVLTNWYDGLSTPEKEKNNGMVRAALSYFKFNLMWHDSVLKTIKTAEKPFSTPAYPTTPTPTGRGLRSTTTPTPTPTPTSAPTPTPKPTPTPAPKPKYEKCAGPPTHARKLTSYTDLQPKQCYVVFNLNGSPGYRYFETEWKDMFDKYRLVIERNILRLDNKVVLMNGDQFTLSDLQKKTDYFDSLDPVEQEHYAERKGKYTPVREQSSFVEDPIIHVDTLSVAMSEGGMDAMWQPYFKKYNILWASKPNGILQLDLENIAGGAEERRMVIKLYEATLAYNRLTREQRKALLKNDSKPTTRANVPRKPPTLRHDIWEGWLKLWYGKNWRYAMSRP